MGDKTVITGMARTAMGGMRGSLASASATNLGATAIGGAITRSGISSSDIDEAIMGCVLPAGLGQAPARQAAVGAGLPVSIPATTINKMCGSGMKAVMLAHDSINAGTSSSVVAGGMESMSNAPHLLTKSREGMRLGHGQISDHMFLDGLEDAYDKGKLMGSFAENCAQKFNFSRESQDSFAIASLKKAKQAIESGNFEREIVDVKIPGRSGDEIISMDEQPGKAKLDKIPLLKPAFAKDGTVTAANSSSISDGAAAMIISSIDDARAKKLAPLAYILGHSSFAHEPAWFTTAPVEAIKRVVNQVGWKMGDVDLFEINEAFAVVTMAAIEELNLEPNKVNIRGGACALGHPIGASGARIIVTLIHALQDLGLKKGVASLCIGGGEATAVAIELP